MTALPFRTPMTKNEDREHPVDEMNLPLQKLKGILAAVMGNYDDLPDGDFKIPAKRVHIALLACFDLAENVEAGLDRLSKEFLLTEKPEVKLARTVQS